MDHCAFDTLFSKNVPHLLEKIFFFLDYESYKTCLEVSNVWSDLLTSDSFKMKEKSVFQTEILNDFYKTIADGDKDKLQKLLSTRMIDVKNIAASLGSSTLGDTPLHWAARLGHEDVVKQLINEGAELNSTNSWGRTPLYQAVQGGNKDVVKLLVDIGADQNIADEKGKTPLTLAREKHDFNIVKILRDREPPILFQDLPLALQIVVVLIGCCLVFSTLDLPNALLRN